MKKRFGIDSEFVLKGDQSADTVRSWTVNIFHQKGTEDFKLPKSVWGWFLDVIIQAYEKSENELSKRMILVKIIHTREVVRAGFDISMVENKIKWNEWQVGTVCLLHDVARFDQALLGSYSDAKTGYEHALVGAKMIENKKFEDFEKLKIDKKSVVRAVKHHSEYQYVGSDVYVKLIRDADKMALLRAMPEILKTKIGDFPENGVTEQALRSYKNGEMVRHANMKTRTDLFLAWFAWENDFNYEETKRLFESEGIKKWMAIELKKRGIEV